MWSFNDMGVPDHTGKIVAGVVRARRIRRGLQGSCYVLGLSCVKDSTVRSSGDPGRLAAIEPRHTVLPRPATCVLCYSTAGAGDRQVPQRVHAVEKCHGCALLSPACPGHLEAENVVGSH